MSRLRCSTHLLQLNSSSPHGPQLVEKQQILVDNYNAKCAVSSVEILGFDFYEYFLVTGYEYSRNIR